MWGRNAVSVSDLDELVFADSADWAYPVVGDFGEGGAGGDAVVGVTYFGVVDPIAYFTYVFFVHSFVLFCC